MGSVEKRGLPPAQVPVIVGFGILILLMLGVAAIGVSHIRLLNSQLRAAEGSLKSELLDSMRMLGEERYQAVVLASRLSDPVARNRLRQRYLTLARDSLALRSRLLALPLNPAEQEVWGEVQQMQAMVEKAGWDVFDLIQAGRLNEARDRIQVVLGPQESRLMDQWGHLVDRLRPRSAVAASVEAANGERAQHLVFVLSTVALVVSFAVVVFVIRLSRHLERDLFHERERAMVTLRALGDAVIRFDQARRIAYLSPVAEALLGVEEAKSANLPAGEVLHLFERESRADLTTGFLDAVLQGRSVVLPESACLLSAQGMEYEVEGKASCIHDPEGVVIGGILVMSDVTEARELQRKLVWQSDHDALTGLGNRYALEERLVRAIAERRTPEMSASLLLIGLENIKQVRARAGQACSDELVRLIALLLQTRMRESDFLARLGEDEFAVLLQSCPNEIHIAERIRDDVMAYQLPWDGELFRLGAHIGVVRLYGLTQEACLASAYAALHEAEACGSGCVVGQPLAMPQTQSAEDDPVSDNPA